MAEIVGSAAAVAQLLEQAIGLWQKIAEARRAVLGAPKAVADVDAQLRNLLGMVNEVSRQTKLQTTSIHSQLQDINTVTTELKTILEGMRFQVSRSPLRQGLHALMKKQRDDATLKDALRRLNLAETGLGVLIQVAHVDLSEGMSQGIVRIEEAVQKKVEGGKLPNFRVEDNVAVDTAWMRNAISMPNDDRMKSSSVSISQNQAWGDSRMDNMILIGPPPPAFSP